MGLDLMNSFPTYLQAIRDMDVVLGNLRDPPTWLIEGKHFLPKLKQVILTRVRLSPCESQVEPRP